MAIQQDEIKTRQNRFVTAIKKARNSLDELYDSCTVIIDDERFPIRERLTMSAVRGSARMLQLMLHEVTRD